MVVQQGQLDPTDTTKNMENYYSDATVGAVFDVARGIHNGTQFVRLNLQRPQAVTASRGSTATPDSLISTSQYIDGLFTASPTAGTNLIRVGFASGQLVTTSAISLFTTQPIDEVDADWNVATSLDGSDAQFSLSTFQATSLSISESAPPASETGGVPQFKYDLSFTEPSVGGLRFWRVTHTGSTTFDDVTEIEILSPLIPKISYFDSDGTFASLFSFDQSNILDAAYDNVNDVFYTIRFNTDNVGTSTTTLSDTFSDADAGTASGTTGFNTARWTESTSDTAFLRVADALAYNVATGNGQLETNYTLPNDSFSVAVDFNPQTVTTEEMWFVLRTLDTSNRVVVQEGVGLETSPTNSGVVFASSIESFTNSAAGCDFREARPLWHNSVSGTDSFTVEFNGTDWAVSGTATGPLTNASTGVLYDEIVEANTPLEFLISCTAAPSNGDNFTFDLVTENIKKDVTTTGVLSIVRNGAGSFSTGEVFLTPKAITSDVVSIELFGNTDGTVNITADNYAVTGSGTFPQVSVFTVERTDNEGMLDSGNPIVIDSFDVIGDSSLNYNDFLDGRVQIAATATGTGGGSIYLKVDNTLYKYPNSVSLGSEDGTSATQTSIGQIAKDGTHSLAWTHESGASAIPFLTYHEFDQSSNIVHLRTIDKDSLLDTTDTKEVLLSQAGYTTSANFKVFYDQNDFDTLYYVDGSTNLQSFNIDDRISAFMAVNAEDTTLAAGTAQQTFVNADVINAWGEALDGKAVTFAVSAGDGAVSPASDTTASGGRATTQFTVGSTVGVSTVTATVTEA